MPLKFRWLERTHICSTRYLQILGITCGSITTNITTNSYVALWPGLRMSSRRNPHAAPCQGFWFCFWNTMQMASANRKKERREFSHEKHQSRSYGQGPSFWHVQKKNGGTLRPFHLSCLHKEMHYKPRDCPVNCDYWEVFELTHTCLQNTNVSRIPTGRPFNNHCQSNQNIQTATVTQSMQKREITTLTASTFNWIRKTRDTDNLKERLWIKTHYS